MSHEIFKKTAEEKKQLKLVKTKESPRGFKMVQPYTGIIPLKLTVYCKYSPKVEKFKSTHSVMCFRNDIQDIISDLKTKGYIINKSYYNGKVYNNNL